MSKANIEWPQISKAVIIFSITIIACAAMIGSSIWFKNRMLLEYNRNKSMFQSTSQRYLAVDQEENMIREYYPQYVGMLENGIIGREQRLNWIEVLRSYGEDSQLPMLNYKISSQDEYTFEYPLQLGNFKLYNTSMKLELKLLHEGDLINLFKTIEDNALGLSRINKCAIQRSQREIKLDGKSPNLTASCEINWFTIKKFDGTELTS
jgi:hypothetical protein